MSDTTACLRGVLGVDHPTRDGLCTALLSRDARKGARRRHAGAATAGHGGTIVRDDRGGPVLDRGAWGPSRGWNAKRPPV